MELPVSSLTLPAGTLLFHGTELEFSPQDIEGPAWFTRSRSVAERFSRGGYLLSYELTQDVTLPCIQTKQDMAALEVMFPALDLSSAEDIADSLLSTPLVGWIIPDNYGPGQDDILLRDLNVLCVKIP